MVLTNALNLPQPFVNAINQEYQYKPHRYSVTQILQDPTKIILDRRFNDCKEQDVSDMVWLIFGSAVHSILEQSQEEANELKECKLECSMNGGKTTLSGIFDLYNAETKTVTDYKTASVWKAINGDWDDYKQQLCAYAYILRRNGFECDNGRIVALLKDHSKAKAKYDLDYPQRPVVTVDFNFSDKDIENIENDLETRLEVVELMNKWDTDSLPPCSCEFRWNDGDKFAVIEKGKKRAKRVLNTKQEAENYVKSHKGSFEIVKREGEDKRCDSYCSVSQFCPYYKKKNEI